MKTVDLCESEGGSNSQRQSISDSCYRMANTPFSWTTSFTRYWLQLRSSFGASGILFKRGFLSVTTENSLLAFIYSCAIDTMLSISADRKNYSSSASYPFSCSCCNGNAGCLVRCGYDKRKVPVSCCALHAFRKVIVSVKDKLCKEFML